MLYYNGSVSDPKTNAPIPTPIQKVQAREWFKKASELGIADAKAYLGNMWRFGDGGDADIELGIQLLVEAAEAGR